MTSPKPVRLGQFEGIDALIVRVDDNASEPHMTFIDERGVHIPIRFKPNRQGEYSAGERTDRAVKPPLNGQYFPNRELFPIREVPRDFRFRSTAEGFLDKFINMKNRLQVLVVDGPIDTPVDVLGSATPVYLSGPLGRVT